MKELFKAYYLKVRLQLKYGLGSNALKNIYPELKLPACWLEKQALKCFLNSKGFNSSIA